MALTKVQSEMAGAGQVLQVVQTVKTDTFSTSSTSYVSITGLSVNITPTSTSNKVAILLNVNYGADLEVFPGFKVSRNAGSSFIAVADSSGSRDSVSFGEGFTAGASDNFRLKNGTLLFIDSPATTSTLTYQVYTKGRTSVGSTYVNRSAVNSDDAVSGKLGISSIIVMEIAG